MTENRSLKNSVNVSKKDIWDLAFPLRYSSAEEHFNTISRFLEGRTGCFGIFLGVDFKEVSSDAYDWYFDLEEDQDFNGYPEFAFKVIAWLHAFQGCVEKDIDFDIQTCESPEEWDGIPHLKAEREA